MTEASRKLQAYKNSGTPKAEAYRERSKQATSRASKAWIRRNPKRRRLSNLLNELVKAGVITKPDHCQSCGKKAKIVGWNIQPHPHAPDLVTVENWYCWGCWWSRKRGEQ